jgi:hypothetical protein
MPDATPAASAQRGSSRFDASEGSHVRTQPTRPPLRAAAAATFIAGLAAGRGTARPHPWDPYQSRFSFSADPRSPAWVLNSSGAAAFLAAARVQAL